MELPKAKSDGKSNKRKLCAYNPEHPGIESSSKVQKIGGPESPIYVPTPKNVANEEETIYEDIINCKDLKVKEEKIEPIALGIDCIKKEEKLSEAKNGHLERQNSSTSTTSTSSRHKSTKQKHSRKEEEVKEKSSKPSSSSRKSSRKDEERSSRKSSSRDKVRKDEKSSKSKSRSNNDEERSSSSSSQKDKKSSRDKERSSSSRVDKDKDKSTAKPKEKEFISIDVSSITYQSCEEDEIDEECRRIFEELKSSTKSKTKPVEDEPKTEPKEYEDILKKKRVAHEGSCLKLPTQIIKRANHTQNAMQAVYNRQEVFRKKLEKEQEDAAEKLRVAQDNLKKAAEEYKKSQEKHLNLTPLIPKSYLTPPTRPPGRSTIAPISNAIALANAKKKVDELLAIRKGFTSLKAPTMATTTAKGSARVAHLSKTSNEKPDAVAPPPLEPGSSKISLNLRMQYYNLMVKHCVVIYTAKEDAWERAQNDELAVLKKCHTPIIYKSSALLAINKLKKEAEGSGNVSTQPKMMSHDVMLGGKQAQQCSWSVNKKM